MRRVLILAAVASPAMAAEARWHGSLSPYGGAYAQSTPAGQALPQASSSSYGAKAQLGFRRELGHATWSAGLLGDVGTTEDSPHGEGDGSGDRRYADGRLVLGYLLEQARSVHELTLDGALRFDDTSRARLPLVEQLDELDARTPRRMSGQGVTYEGTAPLDARHGILVALQLRRERHLGEARKAAAYLLASREMTASWQLHVGMYGVRVDYEREPGTGYGPELRSVHALDEAWQLTVRAGARLTRSGGENGRASAGGVALAHDASVAKATASWQRELETRPGTPSLAAADVAELRIDWSLGGSAALTLTAADRRRETLGGVSARQSISSGGAELTQGFGPRVEASEGADRHAWEVGAGGDVETAEGSVDASRSAWRLFARAAF